MGAVVLVHSKVTVTLELFHPFAFAGGDAVALILGGVKAIFKDTLAGVEGFPARSVAVPTTDWFGPSVVTVCGGGQSAIGAVVGVQWKVTVTDELFQLFPFGGGETVAAIWGGVVAMLTYTVALFGLSATSFTVPVTG